MEREKAALQFEALGNRIRTEVLWGRRWNHTEKPPRDGLNDQYRKSGAPGLFIVGTRPYGCPPTVRGCLKEPSGPAGIISVCRRGAA